ncbi:adenylyl-sulfate kinase [Desulfonatronovibrio magnus]|uniref:adenylyl-sulfate kinase n=1 Tax=Desulfonatronovibrio magnus TaxID=698827 RepID=UPI0005EB143F|nr:adenylyl-sulfate kinase [Desulfonatronovibrio magnus]
MTIHSASKGQAAWFTGLPGSGKSSISRKVYERLKEQGLYAVHLQMDQRRKEYFPEPSYTSEERKKAYQLFAEEAADLAGQGHFVIMDATAPKKTMRDMARNLISRFIEIHIACSLETAMQRESKRPEGLVMADLYTKALERKKTGKDFSGLGQVIGVDVPFEKDPNAECVIENDDLTLEQAVEKALECIKAKLE